MRLTVVACNFSIIPDNDKIKEYLENFTDSGPELKRTFCGECCSKPFVSISLRDEIVSVTAGSLDDFEG